MRTRILGLASLCFLAAGYFLGAAQTAGDKKSDQPPKKEPEKVTAETEINGKNFNQWVALIHGKDRSLTEAALQSIILYPPEVAKNAVPVMIAELKKHNPVNSPIDMTVRTDIPGYLALILTSLPAPGAKEMDETVALLKTMANESQVIVRIRAIQALGQLGPNAKITLSDLIKTARDPNSPTWELRNAAYAALGRVGYEEKNPPQFQVVETLLKYGIKDSAFKVRLTALKSLHTLRAGEFDQYKKEMLIYLQPMAAKDVDPLCRLRAHLSIYPLHTKAEDKKARITSIATFLDNPEPALRNEAAHVIGQLAQLGADVKEQAPRLIKMVKESKTRDLPLTVLCIWSLGQMGKAGEPAVEELRLIAGDMTLPEEIRETAKDAVSGILDPKSKKKDEPKKGNIP
jgi:HEAT repeat protein